jgi:glucose uptake protein GlcU
VLSIAGIKLAGISTAQGVWSGATIVFSFLVGTALFHESCANYLVAAIALIVMMIGIAAIATCTMTGEETKGKSHFLIYGFDFFSAFLFIHRVEG